MIHTLSPSQRTRGSAADSRTWQRRAAAVLMPVGPAAVAVLRYVLPYDTTDDGATAVEKVYAHQAAQGAVMWLSLLAAFTLVPGVLAAGRLVRREAPWLTTVALTLLIPGYLAMGALLATDASAWSAAEIGLPRTDAAALYSTQHPAIAVALAVFVVGHVSGTVLLGIAMWRSGRVPSWAAAAVTVSQPLHFVAAVVLGNHTLDLAAWTLTALGMAVAAAAVLRTPDQDWDLAPRPRPA